MLFNGWSWFSYFCGIATIAVPSLLYLLVLFRRAPVVDTKGHIEPDGPTRRRPTSMVG